MPKRLWRVLFVGLISFPIFLSCLSLPRSYHALEYHHQKVYLNKHHYYIVGPLSSDWLISKSKKPGIVFKNIKNRASLATEATCGSAFEDLPLELLTNHLFAGIRLAKKIRKETWQLSGRAGLYTEVLGELDGAPVHLNIFVIKKEQCQFDFFAISTPNFQKEITQDFEKFVKGFHYQL